MTKKTKAFLRGYGSVLNLKPVPKFVFFPRPTGRKRSHIVSAKLLSDWETIGGDLYKAMLLMPCVDTDRFVEALEKLRREKKRSVERHAAT